MSYTPSTSSTRRAQVRSGDVCLRSLGADTPRLDHRASRCPVGIWTLVNNHGALETAAPQRAGIGLLTIQRPY